MATIKINTAIDADKFEDFYSAFSKFKDDSERFQESMHGLATAAGLVDKSLDSAAKTAVGLSDNMTGILQVTRDFGRVSSAAAQAWGTMARNTKSTAVNIASATVSLLKWADVVGLVTGIVGLGSLAIGGFGISSLASGVTGTRTAAQGLNASYGGALSFRTNFGRYVSPEGFLGAIAGAQSDVGKRLPLTNLGINNFSDRDSAEVGAEALRKLREQLKNVPEGQLSPFLTNHGYDSLVSVDEARRIKNEREDSFQGQLDRFGPDAASMAVSPDTQKKWMEFTQNLDRAGSKINAAFVSGLIALEPGLTKLTDTIAELIPDLLSKDGPADQFLTELNGGLEWLAGELKKPDSKKKIEDFVIGIGHLVKEVWDFGKSIYLFANKFLGIGSGSDPAGDGIAKVSWDQPGLPGSPTDLRSNGGGGNGFSGYPNSAGGDVLPPPGHVEPGRWWTGERVRHAYDRLVAGGISPLGAQAVVARWAYVESPQGPASSNNIGGGHWGISQLDKARWAKVGGDRGFDAQIDAQLAEFKGSEHAAGNALNAAKNDTAAAIGAAMNERAKGYDKVTGRDNFVNQTVEGIAGVRRALASTPSPKPTVTINKNTGGNPVTTSAAAAAPP